MKKVSRIAALLCSLLMLTSCSGKTTIGSTSTSPSQSSSSETETTTSTGVPTTSLGSSVSFESKEFTLTEAELEDKIKGGWIGQMVGVAWGASTEFCYRGSIIPDSNVPTWTPDMINNAFDQDDLYVEIPFIQTMIKSGALCSPARIADTFKKTTFGAWHANNTARENLKNGINYPDSGSYLYNPHCDDIDWQIECDFLGQMYPGLVSEAAARAFELGHIMNYGDGVYGGVFVTAMHSAAFTANSVEELCQIATEVIPQNTKFRMLIDDVWTYYNAGDSFETCWRKIENKWGTDDRCPELSGTGNIDAKLNSGYILMGLLYGKGDFKDSIIYSMRCGQDSDCNPSSVAAILGNYYGAEKLEDIYKSALNEKTKFSTTAYNFKKVVDQNCTLAKEILQHYNIAENNGSWTYTVGGTLTQVPYEQWEKGVYAEFDVNVIQNTGAVSVHLFTYGTFNEIVETIFDMGDGTVLNAIPAQYFYEKEGTYTVKTKIVDSDGDTFEASKQITVQKGRETDQTIICTVTAPIGGGSKDIGVICDGKIPSVGSNDSSQQYDTYIYCEENYRRPVYIGYVYSKAKQINSIVFTEGIHYENGGWFENGVVSVEVLKDGKWQAIEATVSPAYPKGNTQAAFGKSYESYTFTLKTPGSYEGIRLSGICGGGFRGGFISCGELTVN